MADPISRLISAKFGHEIRHDEPLEFTVDEFRRATRAAALAGDQERVAFRAALEAIRDLAPADVALRARIIARNALAAGA